MGVNNSARKEFLGKTAPQIVDAVRFRNHYIDVKTFRQRATGVISLSALVLVMFLLFYFL